MEPAASAGVGTFAKASEHATYTAGAAVVKQVVPVDVIWVSDATSVIGALPQHQLRLLSL